MAVALLGLPLFGAVSAFNDAGTGASAVAVVTVGVAALTLYTPASNFFLVQSTVSSGK